ncbi:hypothetical protein BJ165DRAFT_1530016 [Panaeolus papilionaceus]|nr:hypothetical protein BJ165DRAFT_1530016 [Panaeolus papilionaceus]
MSFSSAIPVQVEDYPTLLWVAIPSAVLVSAYFVRKWYLARRLRLHGIGKGAPGFQTNVKRIAITPEIAARLKRGERVSPEEIEKASREAEERQSREKSTQKAKGSSGPLGRGVVEERDDRPRQQSAGIIERDDRSSGGMNGYTSGGARISSASSETTTASPNGKGKEKAKVEDDWLPENLTRASGTASTGKSQRRKGRK